MIDSVNVLNADQRTVVDDLVTRLHEMALAQIDARALGWPSSYAGAKYISYENGEMTVEVIPDHLFYKDAP